MSTEVAALFCAVATSPEMSQVQYLRSLTTTFFSPPAPASSCAAGWRTGPPGTWPHQWLQRGQPARLASAGQGQPAGGLKRRGECVCKPCTASEASAFSASLQRSRKLPLTPAQRSTPSLSVTGTGTQGHRDRGNQQFQWEHSTISWQREPPTLGATHLNVLQRHELLRAGVPPASHHEAATRVPQPAQGRRRAQGIEKMRQEEHNSYRTPCQVFAATCTGAWGRLHHAHSPKPACVLGV